MISQHIIGESSSILGRAYRPIEDHLLAGSLLYHHNEYSQHCVSFVLDDSTVLWIVKAIDSWIEWFPV